MGVIPMLSPAPGDPPPPPPPADPYTDSFNRPDAASLTTTPSGLVYQTDIVDGDALATVGIVGNKAQLIPVGTASQQTKGYATVASESPSEDVVIHFRVSALGVAGAVGVVARYTSPTSWLACQVNYQGFVMAGSSPAGGSNFNPGNGGLLCPVGGIVRFRTQGDLLFASVNGGPEYSIRPLNVARGPGRVGLRFWSEGQGSLDWWDVVVGL